MNMNLPNKLTVIRIIMIPIFLFFLLVQPFGIYASRFIATFIFVLASLTDFLDGYIARSKGLVTNFGKFMDPLADKLLVCSALIALVKLGSISTVVVIIIISREFIITGFRTLAAKDNIIIAASKWGKFKTIFQMIMIPYLLLGLKGSFFVFIGNILVYTSLFFAVLSAYDYIIKNKQVLSDQT